ncbi:hypothetical protein GQX73_g6335 [Xylaria multiplex]|uniref:Uncharacterized protein n=1 Tax=Xylaria multiplex TaxID=323545 RepID=A0A7C8N5R3_9PEZI|nr:hypothetical protein GQX73_g6335 [Xylaria multiplex]
MDDQGLGKTAMNLWIVSSKGSFHLPIPSWRTVNPDNQLGQIIQDTIKLLENEAKTFGEKALRVYLVEGTKDQRIWTAVTQAHREMYYAGVRNACEDYTNYQIALRLWIQRDLICYSFGIPRVYKDFPYPKPNVAGDNINLPYLYACARLNMPEPGEVEPDKATTMVDDLRSYVEGAFRHIDASLQLIQRRVGISNAQIQDLQDKAETQATRKRLALQEATQSYDLAASLAQENAQLREMIRDQREPALD